MSQFVRLCRIRQELDTGRCLTRSYLIAELEISPATLKRDIALLRDRVNAPIVFDRELCGWRLDRTQPSVGTQYELPGLWLNSDEIRALLMEIQRQNVVQKRYLCILGGGLTLLLLMESGWITTIMNYAVIVIIVIAVMLTAPLWSQLIVAMANRLPWFPKKKN